MCLAHLCKSNTQHTGAGLLNECLNCLRLEGSGVGKKVHCRDPPSPVCWALYINYFMTTLLCWDYYLLLEDWYSEEERALSEKPDFQKQGKAGHFSATSETGPTGADCQIRTPGWALFPGPWPSRAVHTGVVRFFVPGPCFPVGVGRTSLVRCWILQT